MSNVEAIVANAINVLTGPLEGAQLPLPSVRKLLRPQGYPDKVRVRERGRNSRLGTTSSGWTVPSRVLRNPNSNVFLRKQACRGWLFETAGSEEVLGKVQAAFRQTLVVGIRFAVAVAFTVTNARAARGVWASVPDASGLR
jgi:hypothetical protein